MSSKFDDIIARAKSKPAPIPAVSLPEKEMPEYEKDFGNEEAEIMLLEILKNKGPLVEKVERGTKFENYNEKADLWVKFFGMDDPLAIQLTISENEKNIEEKRKVLDEKNWIATKEKRDGSIIDWTGKANIVFLNLDKKKMSEYWEKSNKENRSYSEVVDDSFVMEIYDQILKELGKINPAKKSIIYGLLLTIAKKTKKKG